jgi:hypothetical protein
MKSNTTNNKKNLTMNGTMKLMGSILSVIGFIMSVYAVFNKPYFNSYAEGGIVLTIGITLFMGGGTVARLFEIKPDSYNDEAIISDDLSLVAWNETYLSWMKVVEFRGMYDWDFVLVEPSGEESSGVINSEDRFYNYDWESMTE